MAHKCTQLSSLISTVHSELGRQEDAVEDLEDLEDDETGKEPSHSRFCLL
jgi:hypothetical protein